MQATERVLFVSRPPMYIVMLVGLPLDYTKSSLILSSSPESTASHIDPFHARPPVGDAKGKQQRGFGNQSRPALCSCTVKVTSRRCASLYPKAEPHST